MAFISAPVFSGVLSKASLNGDFADQLNWKVTVRILLFLTILLSAKQYLGTPIYCSVEPVDSQWRDYIENLCLANGTYAISGYPLPHPYTENFVKYYQWIPLALLLQGLAFLLPFAFWKWVSAHFQVEHIVSSLKSGTGLADDKFAESSGRLLYGILDAQEFTAQLCFQYVFMKLLCILNICVQFLLVNYMLHKQYWNWGIQVISDLAFGRAIREKHIFPLVVLCSVFRRQTLGTPTAHSYECVLPMNIFASKVYIFLWYWYALLFVATLASILRWGFFISFQRTQFIYRLLAIGGEGRLRHILHFLSIDGIVVFRFLSLYVGDLTAASVLLHLSRRLEKGQKMFHQTRA